MGRIEPGFFEREYRRVDALEEADEVRLASRWRETGDRAAAHELVRAHLPLVVQLARRYRGYGVPAEELIAEGNLALLRAVEKFEVRGVRFKTYATWWVRAYMLAFVMRDRSLVTQATGALGAKFFFRLRSARARAEALLGPDADAVDELLARQFSVPVEVVRAHSARLAHRADVSLDAPVSDDADTTVRDLLPCERLLPDEAAEASERAQLVQEALQSVWADFDARERLVLSTRLLDEELTLRDLGLQLGLSGERVRQIEQRVKQTLRQAMGALRDEPAPS